jgi:predicted lactoylglutathione lyase
MTTKIFVNLSVKNLQASMEFFGKLGFQFNEKFTNENAACLVISENIYAMLLTESFFQTFTTKEIADTTKTIEVINALSLESREAVDELMEKVIAASGTEARESQDLGFMYTRSFEDPDGHTWELFYMDEKAAAEETK